MLIQFPFLMAGFSKRLGSCGWDFRLWFRAKYFNKNNKEVDDSVVSSAQVKTKNSETENASLTAEFSSKMATC
jgi:hypothetical protein